MGIERGRLTLIVIETLEYMKKRSNSDYTIFKSRTLRSIIRKRYGIELSHNSLRYILKELCDIVGVEKRGNRSSRYIFRYPKPSLIKKR